MKLNKSFTFAFIAAILLVSSVNCEETQNFTSETINFRRARNLEFPVYPQGRSGRGVGMQVVLFNPSREPWCAKECELYNENGKKGHVCGSLKLKSCCNGPQNCIQTPEYQWCQEKIKEFWCWD